MTDYLPARMINELVYCPRLYYLMHVEGQFADSIDTVGGRIVHRRVDSGSGGFPGVESTIPAADRDDEPEVAPDRPKPKARRAKHMQPATLFADDLDAESELDQGLESKPDEDPEGNKVEDNNETESEAKTIHARSVTLSSDALGVIAKLDLVEATGNRATPVDYKRGRPRTHHDGTLAAWDPERVQIALQAMVLRDNGYDCDHGVLYFNETRQRVVIPIDDDLLGLTRAAVDQARAVGESGQIPPPLANSPKCPRCSLVNICLPAETMALTHGATCPESPADGEIRPMITTRDDRRPVYFNTQGLYVGKQSEILQAKSNGKVVQEIRLNEVNQINLFGNVQLSTQAIQTMLGLDVPVLYFTQRGYFYGISGGLGVKNIRTRQQQFRRADDPAFCLDLARQIVHGKIRNQRTLLMRKHMSPSADSLRELNRCAKRALQADSLASLLGIEGNAARIYFADFSGMLKVNCDLETAPGAALSENRPAFDFRGRNRRPPRDPVNALLSLAYSLLTKDCLIAAVSTGLDPHLGFYHQIKPGKPALALDMMEPFRPLIADSVVISAINNRMVTPEHFIVAGQSVVLSDGGRKHFLMAYEHRMDALVTHPLFGYRVSYRRLLEIQTRLLGRLLNGEIAEYPVFQTR
jgi:CRISPR-associated protein Cas1